MLTGPPPFPPLLPPPPLPPGEPLAAGLVLPTAVGGGGGGARPLMPAGPALVLSMLTLKRKRRRARLVNIDTLGPGYMVIGYMVFSGIWSIFGWSQFRYLL